MDFAAEDGAPAIGTLQKQHRRGGLIVQKTALVTAASGGIGGAVARALAAEGYLVGIMARSDKTEALAAEIGGFAFIGDVSKAEDLAGFVEAALAKSGRIDAIVPNSGHAAKKPVLDITDEDWHGALDMMMLPTVRLVRHARAALAESKGAICALSSFAIARTDQDFAPSVAQRAALDGYIRLAARPLAADGIRINAVAPGFVDTRDPPETRLAPSPWAAMGAAARDRRSGEPWPDLPRVLM